MVSIHPNPKGELLYKNKEKMTLSFIVQHNGIPVTWRERERSPEL